MERAGRMLSGGSSRLMTSSLLLLSLSLLFQLSPVSSKLRDIRVRQGAIDLPPLDKEVVAAFLPPTEIAEFIRLHVLARRNQIPTLARDGLPQFGVGPLDPFSAGSMPVNFTMDVVELEGNITNVMVTGLGQLQLLDLHVFLPGLTVEADVRIPTVVVNGQYMLDGSFSGLFPLTGAGPLTLTLTDVAIKLVAQARLYYDRLHITRIDFTLSIGNTTVKLKGFLEDSGFGDLAQQFLNNMSGDFLRNFIKTFREEQLPAIVMSTNKMLRDYQWRTLLPDAVGQYLGFDESSGDFFHEYIPTIVNNPIMDRILGEVSSYLDSTRIGLPAQDIMTRKKVFKWTVHNGIRLFHGQLFGLHTLRRVGSNLISRHKEYFTFTVNVAAFHLKAAYKSQLVIMNKPKQFVTWAFISHLKLRLQLQLDAEYMDVYLTGLDILHIGDIAIELSGLGPLELVSQPVAEYTVNLEKSKRLLAKMAARDARNAVAKLVRSVDLNAVVAELLNGDVYARDPGIIFPDPPAPDNGTDFSSLLESALGIDGDGGDGTGSIISLLLGNDDEAAGNQTDLSAEDVQKEIDALDPDILAAFGLAPSGADGVDDDDGEDGDGGDGDDDDDGLTATAEDPLSGVDPEVLAAFGLGPQEASEADAPDADADILDGVDPDVLAAFGLEPRKASTPNAAPTGADDGPTGAGLDTASAFGLKTPAAPSGGGATGLDITGVDPGDNNSFFDDQSTAQPAASPDNSFFDSLRRRHGLFQRRSDRVRSRRH